MHKKIVKSQKFVEWVPYFEKVSFNSSLGIKIFQENLEKWL